MKALPIGISTFKNMQQGNFTYVDKTQLVYNLATQGTYYFLSRPRRFGKSLFIDTLKQAFLSKKDLFKGLYLENNWDWDQTYPVIHIDFAKGNVHSRQALDNKIFDILNEHAQYHSISLEYKSISSQLDELINKLYEKYQQKVVILVDEYDKPILDNITDKKTAEDMRDGLGNLYSVIKGNDAQFKFVFLTGITKFSKVSLFSQLNNLLDISLDKRYATICGYTETELKTTFTDYLSTVNFTDLKAWYNGYNFLGESVYNPYDILLFFRNKSYQNFWFETSTPTFLVKLIQEKKYYFPHLESIEATQSSLSHFDVERFSLENLLFQTGYLTIKHVVEIPGERFFTLGYPNLEVRNAFTNFLLEYIIDDVHTKASIQKKLYFALLNNEIRVILHSFFASIPHDWYRKNPMGGYEGFYAAIVYAFFAGMGFKIMPEDTSNHGRIDLSMKNMFRCKSQFICWASSSVVNRKI
ncbi:AAA family ATPase [Candidatus Albibeggiatoa sp. nov. BB20]|uniref:ATP-binding protein n=1 Tax=Candidatus Albibeggiatoa sp. nov. BB20 TaxID=3162723 RepID=UPI003365468D